MRGSLRRRSSTLCYVGLSRDVAASEECEVHSDLAKNRSWAEGETKNTKARKTGTDQNTVLELAAQADCLVSHNKSLE